MVSGNQYLVGMGQLREPLVQILEFVQCANPEGIPGVNQQVAVRNLDLAVHAVGVGDADNSHGVGGSGQ